MNSTYEIQGAEIRGPPGRWSYAERPEFRVRRAWKVQENMIRSAVFHVGETLIDDTREWARWADWLGVPSHIFSAVLGAVTAQGRNNAETFDYFRPGFDLTAERQRREDAGCGELIEDADLYPDVRTGLQALRDAGLWVGIAGNQTVRAGHEPWLLPEARRRIASLKQLNEPKRWQPGT